MAKSSVISGLYKLPPKERLTIIKDFAGLTEEEVRLLENTGSLPMEIADRCFSRTNGNRR
jgi:hydroxymethylglutaryl-CoA reductase